MSADLFKIVDGDTGNSVGFYDDRERAFAAFLALLEREPQERQILVLVGMDESGNTLQSWLAEDLALPE